MFGATGSTSEFGTPGAHQETNDGAGDGFLAQFSQPIGDSCASTEDCGGPCVDGVCCDSACGDGADDCQTCSVGGGGTADGVCTLFAAEVVCRSAAGSCDVVEHCPGDAGTCPADALIEDGEPCDEGMCSAGVCVPPAATSTGDSTRPHHRRRADPRRDRHGRSADDLADVAATHPCAAGCSRWRGAPRYHAAMGIWTWLDRYDGRRFGEFGELFRELVTFYSAAADGGQVVVLHRG